MKSLHTFTRLTLLLVFVACATMVFAQARRPGKKPDANTSTTDSNRQLQASSDSATTPGEGSEAKDQDNAAGKRIKKGDKGKEDSDTHHEGEQDESKPIVINFEFYFYGMKPPKDVSTPKGASKAVRTANKLEDKVTDTMFNAFRGTASLTINPDGSYNFAGTCPALYSDNSYTEFALAIGIKSSEGSVILFPVSGSLRYGKFWDKQGTNRTIRDNWKSFAKGHDWRYSFQYQDVVEPPPQSAQASGQNSNGGGPDVGSVLNDVVDALGVVGSILAIF